MDAFETGVVAFNDGFWAYFLIPLLILLSLYFTFGSGLVQFRLIPEMFRAIKERPGHTAEDGGKPISAFEAFAVSAAARIGTGNIAGVATAIALGGAGAVFWMWVMALLVSAASFIESTLAQLYKVRDKTGFRGGPAYYMKYGLRAPWLGVLFAVIITVTFGLVFTMVQSNTIAGAIGNSAEAAGIAAGGWLPLALGVLLAGTTAAVTFGGARRIAHVASLVVPFMAALYILMGLVVVAMNITAVPAMVADIVAQAFGLREAAAGAVGTAVVQGIRRGMFSNEAGLGSAPNAAASAAVSHPAKQGLVQTLGVYFDTLIVCSTTAFIILLSGVGLDAEAGPTLTQDALAATLGPWAVHLLTAVILLVAYTSVLGNAFYGEANVGYLSPSPVAVNGFRAANVLMTFLGAVGSATLVWSMADVAMGVMAVVNLVALAPLAPLAFRVLKDYTEQRKEGRDPVFTRDRIPGLANVHCWEESDVEHFRKESAPSA
ncbi:alanine/glycine:cation symporter family protein [Nocardiopsis potens]|uniref:alanine/glycine:cation symporter family protein n=1 Tax=Nocardiopsis potens TaxID=1246458 RepID=UPI000348FBB6|nr:alanine/glycine:cation symporter family protein [Nocardiopsis potens]